MSKFETVGLEPMPDNMGDQGMFQAGVKDKTAQAYRRVRKDLENLSSKITGSPESFKKMLTAAAPGQCYCEYVYKDADEIYIRPRNAGSGIDPFIGVILNDGSFLELSTAITLKYDTPANGGNILDGMPKLSATSSSVYDKNQIIWFYKKADGTLGAGFCTIPFFYNMPTLVNGQTVLSSLPQMGSTDVGLLCPVGAEIVNYSGNTYWETPSVYANGSFPGTITPARSFKVSSRSSNSVTVDSGIMRTGGLAGTWLWLSSGYRPLSVSTGNICDSVGQGAYKDSGFRILLNNSGNIMQFFHDPSSGMVLGGIGVTWSSGLYVPTPAHFGYPLDAKKIIITQYSVGGTWNGFYMYSLIGELEMSSFSTNSDSFGSVEAKLTHSLFKMQKADGGTTGIYGRGYYIQ